MNHDLNEIYSKLEIDIDQLNKLKKATTLEYFNGNKFSIDAFEKKYAIFASETYSESIKRVCDYIASAENTSELQNYWSERWQAEILFDYWQPGGSIMQGSNNPNKVSLMNCTSLDLPEDSLESIMRYTGYQVARTASYRQGLGVNFNKLRPKGAKVNNSSVYSNGPVSWMNYIDSIGYYVGQLGRIPAMLFSLIITHPSIEEFITVKSNKTIIQNANISVQILNSFYKAVENDKDWKLEFTIPEIKKGDEIILNPDFDDINLADKIVDDEYIKIYKFDRKKEVITKSINARKLLELIAKNMLENAEPGIQNIDIAKKYSNSDYVGFPIVGTNACSEQYLDDSGNCDLASINASKFFAEGGFFHNKKLEVISNSISRFLDNVVSMELQDERYATYKQKVSLQSLRRIGAGFTNISSLLLLNDFEYGSKEGNMLIEEFSKRYNYLLYKNSIALGKEKGSFLAFDKEKYCESPFVKNMMKRFPDLEFNTMRNVCCTSIAPCGTLALMFSTLCLSYGIEPPFGLYFWKRTRISGEYKYYFCVPNDVRKLFELRGLKIPIDSDSIEDTWDGQFGKPIADFIDKYKDELDIKFKDSLQVTAIEKLDLMSKVMKNVDSSISVTYMLPENSDWKDVYDFILEAYKREVKSIAAFPDKKMYGIVSFIPFKDLAFKMKEENVEMSPQNFNESELEQLGIYSSNIQATSAPKRPKELPADIYSVTVKGERFIIAIGLLNDIPYEIFGGHMNGLDFKFQHKKGKIIKQNRGKYELEIGDLIFNDFSQQFTPVEKSLFRSISISLRHGVQVQYIVEQLQKAEDDMFSIGSAASRVLKKYIKDKSKVSGAECPECKLSGVLIYANGCVECSNCSFTKCS